MDILPLIASRKHYFKVTLPLKVTTSRTITCACRVEGSAALAVATAGDWLWLEVVLRDSFFNPVVAQDLANATCLLQLERTDNQQVTNLELVQASMTQNR